MISLETARKLKEAGLKWESKVGDCFYFNNTNNLWLIKDEFSNRKEIKLGTFAPRLDQLLSEIEKRGYWWEVNYALMDGTVKKYKVTITKRHNTSIPTKIFLVDSPEEATAQALIWILEQEVR